MEIEKTYEALSSDILCEHKLIDDGGAFYHSHDGYEVLLVLDGEINFFAEGEGMRLKRGYLTCVSPYTYHRRELITFGKYERIVLNINHNMLKKISTEKTDLSDCFHRLPQGSLNVLYLEEEEMKDYIVWANCLIKALEACDYASDILTEIYIKQILIMINQKAKKEQSDTMQHNIMPPLVAKTIAFIEQHITEEITLDKISTYLYHNGTYISRCFKNITGISLQQFIISKRITLAKKYLREGYSPCDACYMSGFNDYSNFSRTFTKQVGVSPKKFQIHRF